MSTIPSTPLTLAVLISGSGTTLGNLLQKAAAGLLNARVEVVVASNPRAGGLEIARAAGVGAVVANRSSFETVEAFSQAVFDPCRGAQVDLVVMGGFLKLVRIPDDFSGRVMNIHPALIPAFCGRGFYGRQVHESVLARGCKVSGCTVHFVDNVYDHGPIILQQAVPVQESDTPETLAERVFAAECEAYPRAIELFAARRLKIEGSVVRVLH
jgi:phosphoribosylglycinamide formyltransferase 1